MNDKGLGGPGATLARTLGRVLRRLVGLVLLVVAIGLSTCQALDAVREPADAPRAERPGG